MIRGQRPKPARLKLLDGNPGKKPIPNEPQPTPVEGGLEAPAELTPRAKAEWDRLIGDVYAQRVVTTWDRATMAAYCQSYADWIEAQLHVNADGPVIPAKRTGTPMANPYLIEARRSKLDMLRFASDLGLTPVSRARLGTADAPPEAASDVPPELRDVSGGR